MVCVVIVVIILVVIVVVVVGKPSMFEYVVEFDAFAFVHGQTRLDQLVHVTHRTASERVQLDEIVSFGVETTLQDVHVLFERYVAVDHVEEEHA